MDTVKTFTATIWVGLKDRDAQEALLLPYAMVTKVCQEYCDEVGLCVTVTPTTFIYTNGSEPGVAIGLINYPRFPSSPINIRAMALDLARRLLVACKQYRVTVVFPDKTIMLSNPEKNHESN